MTQTYNEHQAKRYNEHYSLVLRMYELGYNDVAHKIAMCPQPGKPWHTKPCKHRLCPYCGYRKANARAKEMYKRVYFSQSPAFITLRPTQPRTLTDVNKDLQRAPILKAIRHKIIYREYDNKCGEFCLHVHIIGDLEAKSIEYVREQLHLDLPVFEYDIHVQPIQRTRKDVYNVLCYATKIPSAIYYDNTLLEKYLSLVKARKLVTKTGMWNRRTPGKRLTPYKERRKYYFDFTHPIVKYHRMLRISTITGEIRDITANVHGKRE